MISRPLRLIGEDERDGTLLRRVEHKFVFDRGDLPSIRSVLRGKCDLVVHRYPVTTVRSLYFDDARLRTCRANLDGVSPRAKLRLRWYDGPQPQDVAWFEVKWRRNRVTGKRRFRLSVPGGFLEQRYTEIVAQLASVLPDDVGASLLRHPCPVLLVEYRREHFEAVDAALRVTLDHRIRYLDQGCRIRPALPGTVPARFGIDEVVLEAKIAGEGRGELGRSLHPLVTRPTASSKYVRGCRELGLVHA